MCLCVKMFKVSLILLIIAFLTIVVYLISIKKKLTLVHTVPVIPKKDAPKPELYSLRDARNILPKLNELPSIVHDYDFKEIAFKTIDWRSSS